jgi:trans-aconitate methyltransferase
MASKSQQDDWSSGDAYEAYVGRWSRLVAREFVAWLDVGPGLRWFDVGCGTGALSAAIVADADPAEVLGVDASLAYVEDAQRRLDDARVRFDTTDAASLDIDQGFDVAASGLVLNFLPDPRVVVAAMGRAVADGGVVAAYVWDYADRMELMRYLWDAARQLDTSAGELDEGVRFPLCDPARLAELWEQAGLGSIETTALDVATVFADFNDYWSPFLGGQGPAPGYVMSRSEEQRNALREVVRGSLPIAADGSISLTARAWAVRGQPERRGR